MTPLDLILAAVRIRPFGGRGGPLALGIMFFVVVFAVAGIIIAIRQMPPNNPLEGFEADEPPDSTDGPPPTP